MIKWTFKAVGTVIVLVLIGYFFWSYVIPKLSEHEQRQKESFVVKRVIDGDTFELDGKDENGKYLRVRLLGIDTPEKFESGKLDKDVERSGKDKKTIQRLG